jgi:hypothetical protein
LAGSDVVVSVPFTVTSTNWQDMTINVSTLFTGSYLLGGSLVVPGDGIVSVPAGGSAQFTVNFTIEAAAVTSPDTMVMSLNVTAFNATLGPSLASTTKDFFLATQVELTALSWWVNNTLTGSYVAGQVLLGPSARVDVNLTSIVPYVSDLRVTVIFRSSDNSETSYILPRGVYTASNLQPLAIPGPVNMSFHYEFNLTGAERVMFENGYRMLFYDQGAPTVSNVQLAGQAVSSGQVITVDASDVSGLSLAVADASPLSFVNVSIEGVLATFPMNWSGSAWTFDFHSTTPGFETLWVATKLPRVIPVSIYTADVFGNQNVSAFSFTIQVVDTSSPQADLSGLLALAEQLLAPNTEISLKLQVPVPTGETSVRRVVLFISPVKPVPGSTSLAVWLASSHVSNVSFMQVSSTEWVGTLPKQEGGTTLYWAVYTEDYAGNVGFEIAGDEHALKFAADQEAIQASFGFVLIGVLFFGMVFAASYRVQQGVQSVKKAKKVSTGVQKAAPGKTLAGTGKKTPISKDIPTKPCPVCKAKIGADLDECPYCHKKF